MEDSAGSMSALMVLYLAVEGFGGTFIYSFAGHLDSEISLEPTLKPVLLTNTP